MYVLQPTTSRNDRLISGIITSLLLLGTYFVLQWAGLPEIKQKTETYQEINWTKFRPKPEKIVEPEPVKADEPTKVEPPRTPPQTGTVEKIDLSSVQLASTLDKPAPSLQEKNLEKSTLASNQQTKIDLKNSSLLSGLNTLMGESSQKLKLPNRGRGGSAKGSSAILVAESGTDIDAAKGADYGGSNRSTLGAPQAKNLASEVAQVPMLDASQLGGDFEDLSPIYRALVVWMKQHPADFPEVAQRFMEKSPGDLTSLIHFQIGNRQFQMFLLCKEKLYEVRVCLLEGNESTYLIDRGFKEASSFLRVGSVNRHSNGNIISFNTTRKAASNARTREFYQLFLSWWESVDSSQ